MSHIERTTKLFKRYKRLKFVKEKEVYKNYSEVIDQMLGDFYKCKTIEVYKDGTEKPGTECNATRRSLLDMYNACRYYFPDTTIEDIFDYIETKKLAYWRCDEIRRVVFFKCGLLLRSGDNRTILNSAKYPSLNDLKGEIDESRKVKDTKRNTGKRKTE